jgi:hypothetical protein
MIKVLDLFCGTGSISKHCAKHPDKYAPVTSVDVLPKCKATITSDVMDLDYRALWQPGEFDIVWASPPCTHYSIARTTASTPRDIKGSNAIVQRTLDIIAYLKPRAWFMENPKTGLLKIQEVVAGLPYHDVTYCMYGFEYQKPTRIWTNVHGFEPKYCKLGKDCGTKVPGFSKTGSLTHKLNICGTRSCSQNRKFSVPSRLIDELFDAALRNHVTTQN